MQRKILIEVIRKIREGNITWLLKNISHLLQIILGYRINRPLAAPLLAGLLVTYRCNLRCLFCDYPKRANRQKEITTVEFKDIIKEFHRMGTPAIGFAGGDPVLRDDIWELVKYACDLGFTVSLGSNGTFWNDKTIARLFNSGLHLIGFSLESPNPEIHDNLQNKKGAWQNVCNTIKKVDHFRKEHNKKITISISVNFNFKNIDEIILMPAFAATLGADQVNFIGMETGAIENKDHTIKQMLDLSKNELAKVDSVVDKLIALKKKNGNIDNSIDSLLALKYQARGLPLPVSCYTGFTSLYVDCYKNIYSCMAFMESEKSLPATYKKGNLAEIWKSTLYNTFREKHLNSCRQCFWPCQNEMNYLLNLRKYLPGLSRFKVRI